MAWDQASVHHGTQKGNFLGLIQICLGGTQPEKAEPMLNSVYNSHDSRGDRDLIAKSHRFKPIIAVSTKTKLRIEPEWIRCRCIPATGFLGVKYPTSERGAYRICDGENYQRNEHQARQIRRPKSDEKSMRRPGVYHPAHIPVANLLSGPEYQFCVP